MTRPAVPPKPLSALLLLAAALLSISTAAATDVASALAEPASARPRIGLVLSGGGARGLAHIGALRVLEELRVPIDAVAGTSMGAVIGGLYASGLRAAEIERLMRSVDWQDAFRDRPARRRLDFRRKQDDREFLVQAPLGIKSGRFRIPRGLVQGQKLNQMLRRELGLVAGIERFDDLPIPFRAVATNIETGERRVFESGDLVAAMRASMSAPGVFAPVEIDGQLYADGGVVDNLPVDVARAMGVDVLIVVDVTAQLQPRRSLDSALALSNQMITVMMRRQTAAQRALLSARDVVIDPAVQKFSQTDFTAIVAAAGLGAEAARERQPALAALAAPPEEYARLLAARERPRSRPPRVDFVRTDRESSRYEPLLQAALGGVVGPALDADELDSGLALLYGDDLFESIDYRLVREDERQGLEFRLRRKSWGPNYIRFGLELQDDFEGSTSYNAKARILVTEVNSRGAEWLTDLQVGGNPKLFTELYQPLAAGSPWFVAPSGLLESNNVPLTRAGATIAEYRLRQRQLALEFGRELGNWGELRAGLRRGHGGLRLGIGDANEAGVPRRRDFERGEGFLRFSIDRLDSVFFPRRGGSLSVEWTAARRGLGADVDSDTVRGDALLAGSRGRNTFVWWTSFGSVVSGRQDQTQDWFSLGGLFQLSGLSPRALAGPHFGVTRGIYYRQIGRAGEGLFRSPLYVGASIELGNVWQRRSEIGWRGMRYDGALFVGLDSLVGPIYLAAGMDEDGQTAFYLLLGRAF
jgi:NTE family protein